ncbi:exported hypothetical protein [Verrucomicrobia bacterium]|nr:exported hypothetical protein [Verrucomicrobiota bacterium]
MAKFIACLITYAATAWTPPASAADRHWLGSTSPFLSEPSNWDPPGPLQNGDALIFDHNSNTSMNNDTVGLTFDHVAFRNYDFQINGNPLTLAPATIGDAEIDNSDEQDHHHSATINCDLVLGADAMFQTLGQSTVTCFLNFCNDGTMNTYLNGAIDLNGHNLTLEVEASFISSPPNEWVCPAAMYLSNSLEGTGNVTAIINGPAQANSTLEFNGSVGNTYRGYLRLLAQGAVVDFNKTSGVVVNDRLILDSASVELLGPQQVGPNASVEINGGGSLYCDADQTIGSLSITNGSGNTTGTWVTTGSHVLALNGNLTCATDNTNNSSFITGNLNLNGYLTFEINGINPTALWLGAVITGNGFVKTGNGTMSIGGNNTYWGDTEIQAGTIAVGNTTGTTPFGQSAQPSFGVHLEGGNIVLQNVSVGAQPLFVSTVSQGNSFLTAIGQCGWAGPVSLDATLNVIAADPTASGQFTDFSGPISGSGGLYLAPALLAEGAVQLSGSSANTFTGPTAVDCPLLKLAKPTGVAALSGPLIVGDDGFAAEVRWLNAYQATGVPLTLYPQALVNLNNNNEDFHEVTFNGGEVDTGTGQFGIYAPVTVNPSPTSAVINGLLGLPAGADRYFNVGQGSSGCDLVVNAIMFGGAPYLHKQGPGTMCLTSANSYTGITIIENGILDVNNAAALGSVGAPTIIGTTGTLQLNGSGTMIQNFEMAGAGAGGTHGAIEVPAGSSYTLNGSILLDTATTFNVGAGGSLGLGSTLSGTGPVLKSGLGQMILGGSTGNTYSGDTLVHGGTLYLGKPSGVEAIPGNLVIGGGTAATTASARHLRQLYHCGPCDRQLRQHLGSQRLRGRIHRLGAGRGSGADPQLGR